MESPAPVGEGGRGKEEGREEEERKRGGRERREREGKWRKRKGREEGREEGKERRREEVYSITSICTYIAHVYTYRTYSNKTHAN